MTQNQNPVDLVGTVTETSLCIGGLVGIVVVLVITPDEGYPTHEYGWKFLREFKSLDAALTWVHTTPLPQNHLDMGTDLSGLIGKRAEGKGDSSSLFLQLKWIPEAPTTEVQENA